MAAVKPVDGRGQPLRLGVLPEEAARAEGHITAPSEVQADMLVARTLESGRLADGVVDRRMEDDHARPVSTRSQRPEQVAFDGQARLGFIADELANDVFAAVFLEDLDLVGRRRPIDRTEERPPLPQERFTPGLPGRSRV